MKIDWNAVGERIFEAGVDRGVLYVDPHDGVPWNGLISVTETPKGGEVTPYYIDGVKYLNHMSSEEYEADLKAFTYPDEFDECDGLVSVGNGLFATQQSRKPFDLCYRTLIGNDIEGTDHGYKLHLVYNAMAQPGQHVNDSVSESITPSDFSWHIVTKPPDFVGYKPTSHFVIDSRDVPSQLMTSIEEILYGTVDDAPRMPSVPELLFIFESYEASGFDAGTLTDTEVFLTFDAGVVPEPYTDLIDGGGA